MTMTCQNFNLVKFIRQYFPIYADRYVVYELGKRDIAWYRQQLVRPFFNANIVNGFKQIQSADTFLQRYMMYVENQPKDCLQVRLVIRDIKTGTMVGGFTIFLHRQQKVIELAYWIVPEEQGKGIMSTVFKEILYTLNDNLDSQFYIHLEIFDDNEPQKAIAIKNGFFEIRRKAVKGMPNVIVYGLDRRYSKIQSKKRKTV